jgi:putative ABC transport system permease protein
MRLESFTEGARLAIDQMRQSLFRSILTILGIVVGVATVMLISAVITGIRTSIMSEFDAAGPTNFYVARFDINGVRISDGRSGPPWGDNPRITVDEAREIGRLRSPPGERIDFGPGERVGRVHAGHDRGRP